MDLLSRGYRRLVHPLDCRAGRDQTKLRTQLALDPLGFADAHRQTRVVR